MQLMECDALEFSVVTVSTVCILRDTKWTWIYQGCQPCMSSNGDIPCTKESHQGQFRWFSGKGGGGGGGEVH